MLQDRDKQITKSIENFNESLPSVQREIYSKIVDFISDLAVDSNGKIKPTKSNLVNINKFKSKIKKTLNGKYKDSVEGLISSWTVAENQTKKYFKEIAKNR